MGVSAKDYVDALIVLERSVKLLQQALPDKKYIASHKAVEECYQAVLALDLYLMGKTSAPETANATEDR